MPDAGKERPCWPVQEQAIQIWERASSMRRTGKVPSIADFEKLMVVAHVQRTSIVQAEQHVASHPAAADAAMADMSVRCPPAPPPSPACQCCSDLAVSQAPL